MQALGELPPCGAVAYEYLGGILLPKPRVDGG